MTVRGQRAGRDDALDRGVGPDARARAGRRARGAGTARGGRGRLARACTGSARRSRARCRTRCCRRSCPRSPGIETAALYRAAGEGIDVGGDFYDLFNVADDEWIAVIGDVCGKGAEAAAVTALARYTIRTAAVRRRSPAAILRWLNDAMCRQELDGRFCTIACVHLDTSRSVDPRCGRVRRASAGAAAAGRRGGRGARGRPARCSGSCATRSWRTRTPSCARATRWCSTRTGSPRRARLSACSRRRTCATRSRAEAAESPQQIVERLTALAVGKEGTPPRDDIAVLALRARG